MGFRPHRGAATGTGPSSESRQGKNLREVGQEQRVPAMGIGCSGPEHV